MFVRKYMIHESRNKAEPLIFKRRHHFIVHLIPLLCSNYRYRHALITDQHDDHPNFAETSIMLPWLEPGKVGYKNIKKERYLSPESEREYRNILTLYFNVFITKFVHDIRQKTGAMRIDAVRTAMNQLMLDEDEMPFDSFYRYYSRKTEIDMLINIKNGHSSALNLS